MYVELIEFLIPNLSQIYFCIPETFKYNKRLKSVFEYKLPFAFVFLGCEFTKVIVYSKSWCEMFELKLSGIKIKLYKIN